MRMQGGCCAYGGQAGGRVHACGEGTHAHRVHFAFQGGLGWRWRQGGGKGGGGEAEGEEDGDNGEGGEAQRVVNGGGVGGGRWWRRRWWQRHYLCQAEAYPHVRGRRWRLRGGRCGWRRCGGDGETVGDDGGRRRRWRWWSRWRRRGWRRWRRAARAGASVEGRTFGEDSQLEPLGNERMKLPLGP